MVVAVAFNEEQGQAVLSEYFLLCMTDAEPPSVEDLYEAFKECDEDG